jgi:hypothetical protein
MSHTARMHAILAEGARPDSTPRRRPAGAHDTATVTRP